MGISIAVTLVLALLGLACWPSRWVRGAALLASQAIVRIAMLGGVLMAAWATWQPDRTTELVAKLTPWQVPTAPGMTGPAAAAVAGCGVVLGLLASSILEFARVLTQATAAPARPLPVKRSPTLSNGDPATRPELKSALEAMSRAGSPNGRSGGRMTLAPKTTVADLLARTEPNA